MRWRSRNRLKFSGHPAAAHAVPCGRFLASSFMCTLGQEQPIGSKVTLTLERLLQSKIYLPPHSRIYGLIRDPNHL